MSINGLPQNSSIENTKVSQTSNPKKLQGQVQIDGRAWSIKQMDNSFSKENTTDKKATFLHDATHLHERQEVHEKGIFHANYGGKGFFGSIGQFFKNIKLSFEKNDMAELKKILDQEYSKYSNAYTMFSRSIGEDKKEQLHQLQTDITNIRNFLNLIASNSSLPNEHPLWGAVDKFQNLGNKVTPMYNQIKSKNT